MNDSTNEESHIVLRRHDAVLEICLNRPDVRNALSTQMMESVAEAFADVRSDPTIRAALITAQGISFCAGGDVKRQGQDAGNRRAVDVRARMMGVAFPMVRAILSAEVPVLAAVQGHAYGAGFSLALATDQVIASENATFCQAFVHRGLVPDLGSTLLLPSTVGRHRAMQLMMSGDPITAFTASEMGFVQCVVAADELHAVALERAELLASGPTVALGLMKKLVVRDLLSRLEVAVEAEAAAQACCVETDDHREGIASFAEKRAPTFHGH